MSDRIVQLQDYNSDNIYPVAGAATQGSITKTMLDEGVFEGPELSDPGNIAYVGTSAIQDNAVTADKIAIPCPVISDILSTPSSVAYVATDNIQDGAVTSDKIDWTTIQKIDISDYLRSVVTPVTAIIYRFGRLCVLDLTVTFNEAVSAGTWGYIVSGTNMPANLRPAESMYLSAWEGSANFALRGIINSSGQIAFLGGSAISSGHYIHMGGAYIAS